MLLFEAYHLYERFRLIAEGVTGAPDWAAMLDADGEYDGEAMPAYQALARLFDDDPPTLQDAIRTIAAPVRQISLLLQGEEGEPPMRLGIQTEWAVHRARLEAWLVNGPYSFIENNFNGSIAPPSIDTWNAESGPGWEPIEAEAMIDGSMIRFYKMLGDIGPTLAVMAGHADDSSSSMVIEAARSSVEAP